MAFLDRKRNLFLGHRKGCTQGPPTVVLCRAWNSCPCGYSVSGAAEVCWALLSAVCSFEPFLLTCLCVRAPSFLPSPCKLSVWSWNATVPWYLLHCLDQDPGLELTVHIHLFPGDKLLKQLFPHRVWQQAWGSS